MNSVLVHMIIFFVTCNFIICFCKFRFQSHLPLADLLGVYWKREIHYSISLIQLFNMGHICLQTCTPFQLIKLTQDIHNNRYKYAHKCLQQRDAVLDFYNCIYIYKWGQNLLLIFEQTLIQSCFGGCLYMYSALKGKLKIQQHCFLSKKGLKLYLGK